MTGRNKRREFGLIDITGQCWQAEFAFWIIGCVFLVWMMVMASQVNSNQYQP
jgi:hypothetical protein